MFLFWYTELGTNTCIMESSLPDINRVSHKKIQLSIKPNNNPKQQLIPTTAASSKPLPTSALGIPYASLFYAPAASSKATFRKCIPHPVCALRSSSVISKPLSVSAPCIQYALFFHAPAALSTSHFPQVHTYSACIILYAPSSSFQQAQSLLEINT